MPKPHPQKIRVQFVGLEAGETPPAAALYELDERGRPAKKLARVGDGELALDDKQLRGKTIALGPDTEDPKTLDEAALVRYRADQVLATWRDQGLLVPRVRWEVFLPYFTCVSGRARKCRPWWWDRLAALRVQPELQLGILSEVRFGLHRPDLNLLYPLNCLPLCDGIVEVYERVCCCRRIIIDDILDRLRELLERVPIPIPEPWPPWPLGELEREPGFPRPSPRLDLAVKAKRAQIARAATSFTATELPPERVYDDYLALRALPRPEAERYVLERPYLYPFLCFCTTRKVGETPLQPGGEFDFCYRSGPFHHLYPLCTTTYAFKVRQRIGGAWVVVYDGLAAHDYFSASEEAVLSSHDSRALVCGDGPGDPPPSDGVRPFVMLEYVTGQGTRHFNFPAQNGLSQVAALAANSGLYTTGYAPDCPWGSTLGLRLWVDSALNGTAVFYRFSVRPVNDAGQPTGAPVLLDAGVSWDHWELVGGDWVPIPESLAANPASVGGEIGLNRIPYWSGPGGKPWLSSQYHQLWNTNQFTHGKYLLILELFDGAGGKIKPAAAPAGDPGVARNFEFRRWDTHTHTEEANFGDLAHVFWVDNIKVVGDIVDLRQNGAPNEAECQFMVGPGATSFLSIGYRAYHVNGVSNTNSFMYIYGITWQRGLNGPTGNLNTGLVRTTDAGEGGLPAQSASESFQTMLGGHQRCTFSVHLAVHAKHYTGGGRIDSYDYHETASFALEQT